MAVIHLLLLLVPLSSSSTTTSFEQFGLKFYLTVSQNKKNENIFLSPASISLAMSMCTVGARQETLNQMLKTFEVSSRKELIKTTEQIIHIFSIANQDKQIQFKLSNPDIKQKDFENEGAQAVQRINAWVEQQTNNLIRDLLSIKDVTFETKLIIINSIYFKNNDLRVQIVHVSYKSEDKDTEFVFTVILPNRGVQLDVVEQKLASQPNLMQIK
ncbi:unnamed protein product [Rotaria sordida]|uniref:Serpin domain-containing protein n=1 Tax=Rotaria sordida TaxID=392033 RepID=A0A815K5Q9_9BILA|nr:unnamed protein product [Rotaria sordida]